MLLSENYAFKTKKISIFQNQCPDEHPKALENLEKFLTESRFSQRRQLSGTSGLSTNQIVLLTDTNQPHQQVCKELRSQDKFNPTLLGDTVHPVYYKVGEFYFVSIPLVKDKVTIDGTEFIISGEHTLEILDSNLNVINTFGL